MSTIDIDKALPSGTKDRPWELELRVNNHPGVMSHICGLFSCRAFNVEKILCLPIGNGKQSKICLSINPDSQIEQIIKQLMKLEDVLEVRNYGEEQNLFGPIEICLINSRA